ncbi:uncharacterized protein BT62DRAFT_1070367 [Guyanagaster necrorhizus]|uniref:Uncharacterized protein n=1 Tax=Guyanagaster necrorhizus TaxID=856835 RepID=A0A9P7W4V3_9AGAR|nr:uncharacterized protein BT62DRAFT_1070367 [Guyanagaster necrorhizus MCA 3950]KAG7452619.1 hypothetical protein BT62DRAFT_1070367 [Guyanagaster necrorhizus MCA 3950]
MDYSPAFLKIRAIGLGLILFLSLLAVILFCIQIFVQWDTTVSSERYMIILMLLTHTVTAIMLPILILVSFRPWLDAIRFLFLLVIHISTDTTFTYWFPRYACPANATQRKQCRLFNIYILVLSWIVTAHLIIYVIGLSVFVYRTRASADNLSGAEMIDEEARRDSTTHSMSESRLQSSTTTKGPPGGTPALVLKYDVSQRSPDFNPEHGGDIRGGVPTQVFEHPCYGLESVFPHSGPIVVFAAIKDIWTGCPSPLASSRPPRMPRPSTYGAKAPGPSGVRSSVSPTAISQGASRISSVHRSRPVIAV